MLHMLVQSMQAFIHTMFEQWATYIKLAAFRQNAGMLNKVSVMVEQDMT